MSEKTLLSVRELSVSLPRKHESLPVLSEVSFDLHQRNIMGIIGESGSGKTVLARALAGWIPAPLVHSGGSVFYRGRDLYAMDERARHALNGRDIGFIGADPGNALDPTLPVGTQIVEKLLAVAPGMSKASARRRVIETLEAVRMPSARARFGDFPFQFSGGMMQRVLIVDALVSQPAYLICDNITQPLDVTVAAQILRLVSDLRQDFNTAVLFISSSLATINEIADDVLVLNEGRVVEQEAPGKLIAAPKHDYTRELIAKAPTIWKVEGERHRAAEATLQETPVLSVRDVHKTYRIRDHDTIFGYKDVQAVRGVSFSVRAGENFGLVGESGCGKSTLSRLLSWIETPDQGDIEFKGASIAAMSRREVFDLRRRFQLLLQDPYNAIPPHHTIGRTLAEPLRLHSDLGRRAIREKVRMTMNEVGLDPRFADQLPVGMSAGQLQRVNIARAMVLGPELLILDETLSSLDPVEQSRLLDLFDQLQAKHKVTYIFISHDLAMVRRACTRIAVMYLGRVVELADNHRTFSDPAHPYTRTLLSAVPVIEERRYQPADYLLEGEPPNPIDIPPGCSFRSRCPFAWERCVNDDPPSYPCADGTSACHLLDGVDIERDGNPLNKRVGKLAPV